MPVSGTSVVLVLNTVKDHADVAFTCDRPICALAVPHDQVTINLITIQVLQQSTQIVTNKTNK